MYRYIILAVVFLSLPATPAEEEVCLSEEQLESLTFTIETTASFKHKVEANLEHIQFLAFIESSLEADTHADLINLIKGNNNNKIAAVSLALQLDESILETHRGLIHNIIKTILRNQADSSAESSGDQLKELILLSGYREE